MNSTMERCITTLFCIIDNFCKIYEEWEEKKLISCGRKRKRLGSLSLSELLTIVLYFYISPCKDFKNYYLYHLSYKYRGYFSLPSYSRIIQLWSRLVLPLTIMLQLFTGEKTGIYFVDSSKLSICHAKRTNSNKVFSGIAKIGMSSYGWFMGFKLHIVINNKGHIMAIKVTKGNAQLRRNYMINYSGIRLIFLRNYLPNYLVEDYAYLLGFAKICKIIY